MDSSIDQIVMLRFGALKAFEYYDGRCKKDNLLTKEELKNSGLGVDFDKMDIDKSGTLTFYEVWSFIMNRHFPTTKGNFEKYAMLVAKEKLRLYNIFEQHAETDGKIKFMTERSLKHVRDDLKHKDTFHLMDKNNDDKVTFKELWDHHCSVFFPNSTEELKLRAFFLEADIDRNNFLSLQEITEMKSKYKSDKLHLDELNALGGGCDRDGDGKISCEEFIANWRELERKKNLVMGFKGIKK